MKKHITIAALLVAGTAFANAEEPSITKTLALPDAQENGGQGSYGTTAEAILNTIKSKDYGVSAGNAGGKCDMGGTTEGVSEGYWSGDSITLWGRNGAGGDGFGLNLGWDLDSGIKLSTIELTATIKKASYINNLTFDFGIGVWDSSSNEYAETKVNHNVIGSGTEDVLVSLKFDLTEVLTWGDGDRIAIGVKAPKYTPATSSAVVIDDIVVKATYTTPVPEPSAFGLLAGIGALALVASRRRRK